MYQLSEVIVNDGAPSLINETSFHPSGDYFAVTYETINEVRLYNSKTRKLLKILKNPEAQLDRPHGVLFTGKYIIVTNIISSDKPSTLNVYRNDRLSDGPVQVFQTPFDHIFDIHSLAIRDGTLLATFCNCEGAKSRGAVVSFGFREESGEITGVVDRIDSWFSDYGDAKGICFNDKGTKILVTFQSQRDLSIYTRLNVLPFQVIKSFKERGITPSIGVGFQKFARKFLNTYSLGEAKHNEQEGPVKRKSNPTNGIAIFSIDSEGNFSPNPEQVIMSTEYCRLENIDMFDGVCVVTDLINHQVLIHDIKNGNDLEYPLQTITLDGGQPHGVKFSPDGRLLAVTSFGVKNVKKELLFGMWTSVRQDKVFIFERTDNN